ncbi:MAG TPA: hypothetical protein VFA59_16525 [Vicinamibacterales bacterium]|nr:hypothetical protein [Vicinamibacterales bacterium]
MRWILATLLSVFAAQAPNLQNLPPAYPRVGATKILDNARVQVWSIAWLKGNPSPMHRHIYDLLGIYYSPGDRIIISPEGEKRPVSTKAGQPIFQKRGVTHIEEGVSDKPLKAVFVELKEDGPSGKVVKPAEGAPGTMRDIGTKQLLDSERGTIWAYSYGFGPDGPRHRHDVDTVVIWILDDGPHVAWVPAGTIHSEENVGVISEATVIEIK